MLRVCRQLVSTAQSFTKPPLATAAQCIDAVHLFVCLFSQNAKKTLFSYKLSNLKLRCLLTTYRKSYIGFSKNPTVSVFLSIVMCGRLCGAQTCAHSAIEPSTLAKGFLQGGPKTLKKFRIFEHFEILRPHMSATVTTRGKWSKSGKNPNTSPIHLSHLYRRISHSVLQAGSRSQ